MPVMAQGERKQNVGTIKALLGILISYLFHIYNLLLICDSKLSQAQRHKFSLL